MAEVECCGECRFYKRSDTDPYYDGACHRYPPTAVDFEHVSWPSTDNNWWCGEFQRRETEKKT